MKPSHANCLFVDLGEPAAPTIARLLAAGIVVRTFDAMPNCLRITIGSPTDNDLVLEALGMTERGPASTPGYRTGSVQRATRETRIDAEWALDGSGESRITTGIGFLDHMLTALAFHSLRICG